MRFVYLDESGVGNPENDPFIVVAGVIVDADRQLRAIQKWLHSMIEDHVHPDQRQNFCFHVHQIFHGNGVFSDTNIYSKEVRYKIFGEILEITEKFELPIVMGHANRAELAAKYPGSKTSVLNVFAQTSAASACLISIQRFMSHFLEEVATAVYENHDQAKKSIRQTHNFLKDGTNTEVMREQMSEWSESLPLTQVAETAFFAEKQESSVLQVADAVVFTIKRKLQNATDCDIFFGQIDKQLFVRASAFGPFPDDEHFDAQG